MLFVPLGVLEKKSDPFVEELHYVMRRPNFEEAHVGLEDNGKRSVVSNNDVRVGLYYEVGVVIEENKRVFKIDMSQSQ